VDHGAQGMGRGSWGAGHGSWFMGRKAWVVVHGAQGMGCGSWGAGHGSWFVVRGFSFVCVWGGASVCLCICVKIFMTLQMHACGLWQVHLHRYVCMQGRMHIEQTCDVRLSSMLSPASARCPERERTPSPRGIHGPGALHIVSGSSSSGEKKWREDHAAGEVPSLHAG
jgi:hypothetical protein